MLDSKKIQQESGAMSVKYEKLVARLVAKTKEVSALTSEKHILFAENEAWKLQLRRDSANSNSSSGDSSGGDSGSSGVGAEESMLRDLTVSYSKQLADLQARLDTITDQYAGVSGAEECAEKLMLVDQEKREHLSGALDRTARELSEAVFHCSKLEAEVNEANRLTDVMLCDAM
jgi:hypothetical protein